MTVLITRPERDARQLQKILEDKGIASICEPLLHMQPLDFAAPSVSAQDAIAVTSRHALEGVAAHTHTRDVPVFTVGDQTAETARALGFTMVHSAAGRAQDLEVLIAQILPLDTRIHYPRGEEVAYDLEGALTRRGYRVMPIITYRVEESAEFSPETLQHFTSKDITHVLLYSSKTARVFSRLIEQHTLSESVSHIKILCLSDSMIGCLQSKLWKTIEVAAHPDQDSLIARLQASL